MAHKKEGGGSESTGLGHTIACAWGVILFGIIHIIPNKITFWSIGKSKQTKNVPINLYKPHFVQIPCTGLGILGALWVTFWAFWAPLGDVFFVQVCTDILGIDTLAYRL